MENLRTVKTLLAATTGVILFTPLFVFAYEPATTHKALTREIVRVFNFNNPDKPINPIDAEAMIQGSFDEDNGLRAFHHFYDPIYNRGITFGKEWQHAKAWSQDTLAQASRGTQFQEKMYGSILPLFNSHTDFSWERAIYEYAWGDKKRGFETLGHILHLIEDMAVPDHTRNDPHPPYADKLFHQQSPYEHWADKWNQNTITTAKEIKEDGIKPKTCVSLDTCFDSMALYSNQNFFSKDTILKKYEKPKIIEEKTELLSDGQYYTFGFSNQIRLIKIKRPTIWSNPEYSLTDNDNLILQDYWSHLSRQAVLHGAEVVKLFFDEVEKEQHTRALYEKNRSWITKQMDKIKKGFYDTIAEMEQKKESQWKKYTTYGAAIGGLIAAPLFLSDQIRNNLADLASIFVRGAPEVKIETKIQEIQTASPPLRPSSIQRSEAPKQSPFAPASPGAASVIESLIGPAAPIPLPPAPTENPGPPGNAAASSNTSSLLPIAGVGGAPPAQSSTDTTAPAPPVITTPAQNNQTFTTTSITFSGTAEADATISQNFSGASAPAVGGAWSLTISGLGQGTTTIQFFATDAAGNKSSGSSRSVFVDTQSPLVTLTVNECASSLSPDACLTATTSLSISWSSASGDLARYAVTCTTNGSACSNFNFASTTATSTAYTVPTDNTTYTFIAKAIDTSGNEGPTSTKIVEVATRPLVINEIAWAGTGGSATTSKDEWIELYNPSSRTITLTGITLKSETDKGGPNIALSGTLAPGGYYLIERTDDQTVSNITASTTSSFGNGLHNAGEVLALVTGNATIDRTPSSCGGWCAGSTGSYETMERYDPSVSGELSSNWNTFPGFLANGLNADNQAIQGTPGKRNASNYLIDRSGSTLSTNKTLLRSQSPYIIQNTFTVSGGVTLTIESGVVIKFLSSAALVVDGKILASGSATSSVVFTSVKDDSYGGDTNQDGSATTPAYGNWGVIKIRANGSILDYALIRYGGLKDGGGDAWANIRVQNASSTITNSTIEESGVYGIRFENASGSFESNTIRNNNHDDSAAGVWVEDGSVAIRKNTITNNTQGLKLSTNGAAYSLAVENNTFSNITNEAIQAINIFPSFTGNTATTSGTNGINLQGTISQNHTLSSNLPYTITGTLVVSANKTLTAPAGTILKFGTSGAISVSGKLSLEGSAGSKVILTSLKDDAYGGDTNNDGSATVPAAGNWLNVYFGSGASSSSISHAIVRYGGATSGSEQGAIRIENSSIDIRNSTIERNYVYGVWMKTSTSTLIADSVMRYHQGGGVGIFSGLSLTSSSTPTISTTAFLDNDTHIIQDGSSSYADAGGNTFQP